MKLNKNITNYVVIAICSAMCCRDVVAGDLLIDGVSSGVHGNASWYGAAYRGKRTASGERFDPGDLTAAHPSLPFGTLVEVWRPERDRRVVVRVNDRGPGGGRLLDLSEAAARRLGMVGEGVAAVSLRVIGTAE